jgi:hypothetical protein
MLYLVTASAISCFTSAGFFANAQAHLPLGGVRVDGLHRFLGGLRLHFRIRHIRFILSFPPALSLQGPFTGWRETLGEVRADQVNSFTTISSLPRSSIPLTAI